MDLGQNKADFINLDNDFVPRVSADSSRWPLVTMWLILLCPQKMILLLGLLQIPQAGPWSQCGPFYSPRKWSCYTVAHSTPPENYHVTMWPILNPQKIILLQCGPFYTPRKWSCYNVAHSKPPENYLVTMWPILYPQKMICYNVAHSTPPENDLVTMWPILYPQKMIY